MNDRRLTLSLIEWTQRITLGTEGVPRCIIHEDWLELVVDHFSDDVVTLEGEIDKHIGCAAFMPIELPPEKEPILHVYFYKRIDGEFRVSIITNN